MIFGPFFFVVAGKLSDVALGYEKLGEYWVSLIFHFESFSSVYCSDITKFCFCDLLYINYSFYTYLALDSSNSLKIDLLSCYET